SFSLPTTWVIGEVPTADVFGVTTDTMIESDAPANNFGSSDNLFIDALPARTGLLRFDLGAIGVTARVNTAELHLWTHWNPLLDGTLQVFQMLEAWQEGTVNGLPGVAN